MGQTDKNVILQGKFSLLDSRKDQEVVLFASSLRYAPARTTTKPKLVSLDDVIGVQCMKGSTVADSKAYLTLYVYPKGRTLTGNVDPVRRRQVLVFGVGTSHVFTENLQMAHVWRQAIFGLMRPVGEFWEAVFQMDT
jgi:hypothetical protein